MRVQSCQLFVTLWTVNLLCLWNFPGKNMEWVAISYSRMFSQPRDQHHDSLFPALEVDSFTTVPPRKQLKPKEVERVEDKNKNNKKKKEQQIKKLKLQ